MADLRNARADLERTLRLMDVADEIRRQRRRVSEHLEVSDRDNIHKELLRRYREMGYEAAPDLIDEAIDTVLSQRYRFTEPVGGLGLRLARLYVTRGRWLRKRVLPVAIGLAVILLAAVILNGVGQMRSSRDERRMAELTAQATELCERIENVAIEEEPKERARQLRDDARRQTLTDDPVGLKRIVDDLATLQQTLEQEYTLVILRGRERDNARHYLIVQALDSRDRPVKVRIRNQETGEVSEVLEWGERVSQETYQRIAQDYHDDNVIDDNIFGRKLRGHIQVDRNHPDLGQITDY